MEMMSETPSVNESQPTQSATGSHIGLNDIHKYLGYSTLLLAGVAAMSSSYESIHHGTAYAATGAALATCITGLWEHGDRFYLEGGLFTSDNIHISLSVLGALTMAAGVALSDDGKEQSHAGIASAGAAAMFLGVIVIKWDSIENLIRR